jgi:hypothetical protein
LLSSPEAVLVPLTKICRDSLELCRGDYKSSFVNVLLFLFRVCVQIESYIDFITANFALLSSSFSSSASSFVLSSKAQASYAQMMEFVYDASMTQITRWLLQAQGPDPAVLSSLLSSLFLQHKFPPLCSFFRFFRKPLNSTSIWGSLLALSAW